MSASIYFTGTELLISGILKVLVKYSGVNSVKIRYNHNDDTTNIRTITFGGNGNAKKIYDYLYKNANVYMKRKRNKFEMVTH